MRLILSGQNMQMWNKRSLVLLLVLMPNVVFAGNVFISNQEVTKDRELSAQKTEIYRRFVDNYKTDQGEAAKDARLYLEKFSSDQDERVKYLENFLDKYLMAIGKDGFKEQVRSCGLAFSKRTYQILEGGTLYYTERWFDTAELAAAAMDEAIKSAVQVDERQPLFDESGRQIGERVIVKTKARMQLLKLQRKMLFIVEAPSERLIRRFEAAKRP